MLGYAPKLYRLWSVMYHKIVIGHDVIFNELFFFFQNRTSKNSLFDYYLDDDIHSLTDPDAGIVENLGNSLNFNAEFFDSVADSSDVGKEKTTALPLQS